MADLLTSSPLSYRDFLAKYADADGTKSSAQITASGGDLTSVKLSMSTSVSEDDAQTPVSEATISAVVEMEKDGATVTASGDAAASGETASTSLELNAALQEEGAVAEVVATAEGEGPATTTAATASTDAAVSPELEIVNFQQETVETPGDDSLTVESYTSLEAIWTESFALDSLPLLEESFLTEAGDIDWLL